MNTKDSDQVPVASISIENWISLGVLSVIWGSAFVLVETALQGVTPLWLAAWRITIAAAITNFFWLFHSRKLFLSDVRSWGLLIVFSLFSGALPFQLLAWGQQHVNSAYAGVAMSSVGLIILPLAHILLPDQKITTTRLTGFLLGFTGVVILFGTDSIFLGNHSEHQASGRLACFSAAFCYATSSILLRMLPPIDRIGVAAASLSIGAIVVVICALKFEGLPSGMDPPTLTAVTTLAIIPTAIGNILRIRVIRSAGPVFLSLVSYLVPLWAVIFGIIVMGETPESNLYPALLLILSGIGITQSRSIRALFVQNNEN